MANEAVRTRQYREYLDADKTISRQIYNLYQRQEAAYNEGTPTIRNQNQLAPISGVIEAVSAFQSELQNLMSNATNNNVFANNFVPVVKSFNALVFALRSIQNIYKRSVQIKYEVDKLLKPAIEMIQSVASQLAYDPAISNRLFQMKTNLLSKVFERIEYNVGKRTVVYDRLSGNPYPTGIQTLEPGNDTKMDTFQQPVMQYDPRSNDPFLGKTPMKSEPPATFEGLDVAGYDLTEENKADLIAWQNATKDVFKKTPDDWSEEVLPSMSKRKVKGVIDAQMAKIRSEYSELSENAKQIIEKNNMQQFEAIKKHLTDTLDKFIKQSKESAFLEKRASRQSARAAAAAAPNEFIAADNADDVVPARLEVSPGKDTKNKQRQASAAAASPIESPKTIIREVTRPSKPISEMTVDDMKALLKSANAWRLLTRKGAFLPGRTYEDKAAAAIEKYEQDPEATVDYFKNTLKIDIPFPQRTPKLSKSKTPKLQSPPASSLKGKTFSSPVASNPFASSALKNVEKEIKKSAKKQRGFRQTITDGVSGVKNLFNFAVMGADDDY
jgi:hypothetical protein